jgi:hypothetical protein
MRESLHRRARPFARLLQLTGLALLGLLPLSSQATRPSPNLLFIIMDDVGIDQMRSFGYGGFTPPHTPTIDRIADAGIRFTNTWSMPACSTSRAVFFSGRFPLRTNVYGALGPDDLANAQVSPFEMSLPKLLKQRGYQSALFGKFHLGLQAKNPFLELMPRSLGWDHFSGWLDYTGDPSSIDTSAGGVSTRTGAVYPCGFVPGGGEPGGANRGACYAGNGSCQDMRSAGGVPPGRSCRDAGGIFDPLQRCQSVAPSYINFEQLSAHYVSPLVINQAAGPAEPVPLRDIRARTYRGSLPVDDAIDWIQQQGRHTPWMASVSFASAHTPVMQPPQALLSSDPVRTSKLSCGQSTLRDQFDQRVLTNLMIEAMDTEIARLLVSTGLARRGHDGQLQYNPQRTDTVVVILGDNGTLGSSVKLPFDPTRAKGTAYQTGVWVPLVVAGPVVRKPGREVPHMVNIADLYQLFGELAGIDVQASVPRELDSMPMLPYLLDPRQDSIRSWNFTQVGPNAQADGTINGPCTINTGCTQIPVTKQVCNDNGGRWWGKEPDAGPDPNAPPVPPAGLTYCCQVNQYQATNNLTPYFNLQPLSSIGIRNDDYKVVVNTFRGDRDATDPMSCQANVSNEFYRINERKTLPRIDRAGQDLLLQRVLTSEERSNYIALEKQLQTVLRSQPPCRGDGNIDGVINADDLIGWRDFALLAMGQSSWYDVNLDGLTDARDRLVIARRQGTVCR